MLLLKKVYVPQKTDAPLFYLNPNSTGCDRPLATLTIAYFEVTHRYSHIAPINWLYVLSVIFVELWGGFVKSLRQNITLSADFKTTMSPGL